MLVALTAFVSCGHDAEDPGNEYMPDMGHSIAQEANVLSDYYYNTWDEASTKSLRSLQQYNEPPAGTVARGYAGVYFADAGNTEVAKVMETMTGNDDNNSLAIPMNGSVPYYYEDTEADRTRAIAEIQSNPFPITEEGLARGKELYEVFCGICHGNKGDGNGWLVDEANTNAVYPAAPANFLLDEHINSSNGRYYHAIMYGKNVMGAYKDKINYEERWQVIHYIRALQAKEKKVDYNADKNTLNPAYGTPGASIKDQMAGVMSKGDEPAEEELDPGTDTPPLEEPQGEEPEKEGESQEDSDEDQGGDSGNGQ